VTSEAGWDRILEAAIASSILSSFFPKLSSTYDNSLWINTPKALRDRPKVHLNP